MGDPLVLVGGNMKAADRGSEPDVPNYIVFAGGREGDNKTSVEPRKRP
jgi:hypothetical protein